MTPRKKAAWHTNHLFNDWPLTHLAGLIRNSLTSATSLVASCLAQCLLFSFSSSSAEEESSATLCCFCCPIHHTWSCRQARRGHSAAPSQPPRCRSRPAISTIIGSAPHDSRGGSLVPSFASRPIVSHV
ncbi:uncharacterized protein CCOS01_00037 [Colletotrichum costaricense]|uniref:Uncharacterized protein n=1 Tax=Colletotrichum costaricense TaxID=1209916 RepID=A0AAI9Z867_9PEZI|nr:uncharacterized protein CCOS01_00037 [Colletotrichum costaricense]KAK1538723.1 hypothetical protein CCOS01_00037 [Colletotrichum costaricense]